MPTAVLDLDYGALPDGLSLAEHYGEALALIRVGGRPAGIVQLRLRTGVIDGADLRAQVMAAARWPVCMRWVHTTMGLDEPPPPAADATVAVCTRDRPDDLRRCLESLLAMPDDGQELIVVDNAPSDQRTRDLVAAFPRVRYLREDRPGITAARNRAMREARGAVVAFTDDDAVVDPGWLRAIVRDFDDPLVACVTGLVMPLELETEAQEAFERWMSFGRGVERREFHSSSFDPLLAKAPGSGNSMALRRSAWRAIGPFSTAFGVGTVARSGGEVLWFSQALAHGHRIIYEPAALSWHRHRATEAALISVSYSYGVGYCARALHQLLVWREGAVWGHVARMVLEFGLGLLLRGLIWQRGTLLAPMMRAWLRGFARGPAAYFASRRHLREHGGEL